MMKGHKTMEFHSTLRSAGKGGKGGGHPSNVLQDRFSNSSNSGIKIAGGGG